MNYRTVQEKQALLKDIFITRSSRGISIEETDSMSSTASGCCRFHHLGAFAGILQESTFSDLEIVLNGITRNNIAAEHRVGPKRGTMLSPGYWVEWLAFFTDMPSLGI